MGYFYRRCYFSRLQGYIFLIPLVCTTYFNNILKPIGPLENNVNKIHEYTN